MILSLLVTQAFQGLAEGCVGCSFGRVGPPS